MEKCRRSVKIARYTQVIAICAECVENWEENAEVEKRIKEFMVFLSGEVQREACEVKRAEFLPGKKYG